MNFPNLDIAFSRWSHRLFYDLNEFYFANLFGFGPKNVFKNIFLSFCQRLTLKCLILDNFSRLEILLHVNRKIFCTVNIQRFSRNVWCPTLTLHSLTFYVHEILRSVTLRSVTLTFGNIYGRLNSTFVNIIRSVVLPSAFIHLFILPSSKRIMHLLE